MRSIKLLAALAVPAMFAACSNEEMFTTENAPQQMEEVVGTKLVGTDVSLNATKGGEFTRLTTKGVWEAKDLIGLGWITKTGPSSEQAETALPDLDKLYANHMFSWDKDAGEFTSKGNIYEGWYFAYYPWTYEKKVVDNKIFQVNPAQTSKLANDRTSQGLHISNLQFISEDNLVGETNSLKSPFKLFSAVGYLRVQTNPVGEFVKDGELDDLNIQSVTINAGANAVFADSLKLIASKIAAYDYTKYSTEKGDTLNMNGVLTNEVLVAIQGDGKEGRDTKITTDVAGAGYLVSDANAGLITIVVPTTATLDKEDIVIEVAVNSGKFVIKYVEDAATGSDAAINNAAIERIVKEYATNGLLTKAGNLVNLPVRLYGDIFETDFNHISNIEEWEDAVDLVNALGRTSETFKIDSTIVFSDTIPMPTTCKLTVERATTDANNRFVESLTLADGDFYGWPEALTSKVYLTIAEDATLYDAHEIAKQTAITNKGTMVVPDGTKENVLKVGEGTQYTLTNEGTIKLGKYAKAQRVDNSEGRIEVIYGSYVAIKDNKEELKGEIVYVVMPDDTVRTARIQNVINTEGNNMNEYALVNVLKFDAKNGIESFDFTKPISGTDGEEDPYNSTAGTNASNLEFKGLDGVSIEINDVKVTSSTKEVTVKSAVLTGAEASLTNVNVAGDLTVTGKGTVDVTTIGGIVTTDGDVTATTIEGTVTVNGATIEATTINGNVTSKSASDILNVGTINGDLTIEKGGSVNGTQVNGEVIAEGTVYLNDIDITGVLENKGTTTIAGNAAFIGSINNILTLNANTNVTVNTVVVNDGSTLNVEKADTVWYTTPKSEGGYIQKGTTKGVVEYKDASGVLTELTNAFANGGSVTLVDDVTLTSAVTIPAGKEVSINLNGHTLTTSTVETTPLADDITNNGTLTIKNGTVKSVMTAINSTGTLNLENCNVTNNSVDCNALAVTGGTAVIEGGSLTNTCEIDRTGDAAYVVYIDGANTKVTMSTNVEVEVEGAKQGCLTIWNGAEVTLNGGSYTAGNWHVAYLWNGSKLNYANDVEFNTTGTWSHIFAAYTAAKVNGEDLAVNTGMDKE